MGESIAKQRAVLVGWELVIIHAIQAQQRQHSKASRLWPVTSRHLRSEVVTCDRFGSGGCEGGEGEQ